MVASAAVADRGLPLKVPVWATWPPVQPRAASTRDISSSRPHSTEIG